MSKITSIDFLLPYVDYKPGTIREIEIYPKDKIIELNLVNKLTKDGISSSILYSYLKDAWVSDGTLIYYPFPICAYSRTHFELQNGWDFSGRLARSLLKDAQWGKI